MVFGLTSEVYLSVFKSRKESCPLSVCPQPSQMLAFLLLWFIATMHSTVKFLGIDIRLIRQINSAEFKMSKTWESLKNNKITHIRLTHALLKDHIIINNVVLNVIALNLNLLFKLWPIRSNKINNQTIDIKIIFIFKLCMIYALLYVWYVL